MILGGNRVRLSSLRGFNGNANFLAEIVWCFLCSCFAIPLISTAIVRRCHHQKCVVCTFITRQYTTCVYFCTKMFHVYILWQSLFYCIAIMQCFLLVMVM
jgi:hypothetical protein